ncbi:Uncharacterised protein [Nocardia farcinica]|uniref:hypothetical protein n=1 Tax=Nocardia farcinica TaxID=37329 RepID=UPI000DFFFE39|nr:hypothetical protein [Nocardia farcinica]SUE27772.1 Uncharacterised protein [Nocardia farcinica]
MDWERSEGPDGLEIRVPADEEYRTCSVCGGDCEPEPGGADGLGIRLAFVCPEHGPQSLVDPFSDLR